MSFSSFKKNLLKSNQVAAIECNILSDGALVIHTVILKENKSKVEIVATNQFTKITDLSSTLGS